MHSRGNWTFFGSDRGGRTAAVLLSFTPSCERSGVEPFAWFRDVLARIATHPVNRLAAVYRQPAGLMSRMVEARVAQAFLAKPIQPDDLLDVVARVMAG